MGKEGKVKTFFDGVFISKEKLDQAGIKPNFLMVMLE